VSEPTDRAGHLARLLAANQRHAESFSAADIPAAPRARLAILTCMDARMILADIFGLKVGEANVIRNAGAVATPDAVRSLVLSQQALGTREIVVLGHTGCGLRGLDEQRLRAQLTTATSDAAASGATTIDFGSFEDVDDHVREQVAALAAHPLVMDVPIHGLVYEVETGRVRELRDAD
jgi:carbonic anhydrase